MERRLHQSSPSLPVEGLRPAARPDVTRIPGASCIDKKLFAGIDAVPFCDSSKAAGEVHCQIAVFGDASVGKTTCLCATLCGCKPLPGQIESVSTIGLDCQSVFSPLDVVGKYLLRITFWDTAGQEQYRSMTGAYARKVDVIYVMWDALPNLEGRCSFEQNESLVNAAGEWMDLAEAVNTDESPKIIFVVATKCEGVLFTDMFQRSARDAFRALRAKHLKAMKEMRKPVFDNMAALADNSHFHFVSSKLGSGLVTLFTDAIMRFKELNSGKIRLLLRGELKSGGRLYLDKQPQALSLASSSTPSTLPASSACTC